MVGMSRLAPALVALLPTAAQAAGTLVVRAEGLQSTRGEVKVAVCSESFDEAGCRHGASRPPSGPAVEFVFEPLTPGRYAIAVYHDVNGNGELDKMAFGVPTEPYGFSNDVGRLAPPTIERARVDVGDRETVVVVRVRRLLGG